MMIGTNTVLVIWAVISVFMMEVVYFWMLKEEVAGPGSWELLEYKVYAAVLGGFVGAVIIGVGYTALVIYYVAGDIITWLNTSSKDWIIQNKIRVMIILGIIIWVGMNIIIGRKVLKGKGIGEKPCKKKQ